MTEIAPSSARRIKSLTLRNFKAFERFHLNFSGHDAYLVGPNNAGKSTLLAATRGAAYMVSIAQQSRATEMGQIDGALLRGHEFTGEDVSLREENLAHEFEQAESCLDVRFSGDGLIAARWQNNGGDPGGFFVARDNDVTLTAPRDVRRVFPIITVVPFLAPLDAQEIPLSESYVARNLSGRRASAHFRNQLVHLGPAFEAYRDFLHSWTPELRLEVPKQSYGDPPGIDVYYREPGGRHPREVYWVGDGIQIWMQLMLHLWRNRGADVIILDEPEVFLHPDLQRRLVAVLDSHPSQTIMATHSAEIAAEAPTESVFWVARGQHRAIRSPSHQLGRELVESLGSAFNLQLARAFKARAVVFIEDRNRKPFRAVASKVGAERLASEVEIAVISLNGYDRWDRIEPFRWLIHDLLADMPTAVILDRDYKLDADVARVEAALTEAGAVPHVWLAHEFENYLLDAGGIGRSVGLDRSEVEALLDQSSDELRNEVLAGVIAAIQRSNPRLDPKTAALRGQELVAGRWSDQELRLALCPGKEVCAQLNQRLQGLQKRTVSTMKLARDLRASEIAPEARDLLLRLDRLGQ